MLVEATIDLPRNQKFRAKIWLIWLRFSPGEFISTETESDESGGHDMHSLWTDTKIKWIRTKRSVPVVCIHVILLGLSTYNSLVITSRKLNTLISRARAGKESSVKPQFSKATIWTRRRESAEVRVINPASPMGDDLTPNQRSSDFMIVKTWANCVNMLPEMDIESTMILWIDLLLARKDRIARNNRELSTLKAFITRNWEHLRLWAFPTDELWAKMIVSKYLIV